MVQGVAEVHPVSSSAQVTLLPRLLGWDPPTDRTRFAAALHAGSAVGMALALRPTPTQVRRATAASVPAAVTGLLLQDVVERRLGTTRGIAAGLALGGIALWWADTRADRRTARPRSERLTAPALAQVLALAPGVSRQGAVLTALRAQGVDRQRAARTSLLMSLPVTLGAAGLTAVRGRQLPPLLPAVTAGAAAYAVTKRSRWTRNAVRASVVFRWGVAAAVLADDRRQR